LRAASIGDQKPWFRRRGVSTSREALSSDRAAGQLLYKNLFSFMRAF